MKNMSVLGGVVVSLGLVWGANEYMDRGLPIACTMNGDGQVSIIFKDGVSEQTLGWALSEDAEYCSTQDGMTVPHVRKGPTLPRLG